MCIMSLYYIETLNNHNKGNKTMLKRIGNIIAFVIVAEAILFTIFGIIPELLKASL